MTIFFANFVDYYFVEAASSDEWLSVAVFPCGCVFESDCVRDGECPRCLQRSFTSLNTAASNAR